MKSHRYEQRRLRLMAGQVRGRRVLDIGSTRLMNPYLDGLEVTGLDLEAPAELGSYRDCIVGDVMDIEELVRGRTFETVLCGELIEHVERPYDLLRSIRRVLEPGGRLVLSTPNPVAWPTLLAEIFRSRRYFYTEEHVYYFTPRWVVRVLERTGYAVAGALAVGLYLPAGVLPWCPVVLSYQVVYVADA